MEDFLCALFDFLGEVCSGILEYQLLQQNKKEKEESEKKETI